jgi:hypothetical protein
MIACSVFLEGEYGEGDICGVLVSLVEMVLKK